MNRGIRKTDITKTLKKQIDHKSNCYQKYMNEILAYIDSYIQQDSITLFKCVPYYEHLLGKLRKLSIKSYNSEIHVVYLIESYDDYSILYFSMPVQLDK